MAELTEVATNGTPASRGIAMIYMRRLLEVAAAHGVDTAKVLQNIRLSPEALEISEMPYSLEQHIQSVVLINKSAKIAGLGLKVGCSISVSDLGIMGYAMLSSATFGQAVDIAFQFQRLTDPCLHISHKIAGKEVVVTVEPLQLLGGALQYDVEQTFAIWANIISQCVGPEASLTRASLTWRPTASVETYAEFLKCPVQFEQKSNEFRFPANYLKYPMRMANEQASRLCADKCKALLKELNNDHTIVDTVRRVMISYPGKFTDIVSVAKTLHMSPRNLRRRLAESGTSFREVSGEVRMQIAIQYLSDTQLAIEQIAYLVGYTEASNFYRAFKNYTGNTPNHYRN